MLQLKYKSILMSIFLAVTSIAAADGPGRTGGGNGSLSSQGEITPLEVIFAEANKGITPSKEYPVGYRYFQAQIKKIKAVIPSFAKDIEERFARMKWTLTELELNEQQCLNNTGVFKIKSNEKQVVIACQKENGEVVLNRQNVDRLAKPEYMGVLLLHETFVNAMMNYYSSEEYAEAETEMITKIMPYFITQTNLDAQETLKHSQALGFYGEYYQFHPYLLDTDPDTRKYLEFIKARRANIEQARKNVLEKKENLESLNRYLTERGRANCNPLLYNAYMQVVEAEVEWQKELQNVLNSFSGPDSDRYEAAAELARHELSSKRTFTFCNQ